MHQPDSQRFQGKFVGVRVLVAARIMGRPFTKMAMSMKMTFATGMIVQVEMHPCLAHPPKYITPQQNQHEANGALQKGCRAACQCHAQQDHCRTDREQGERMP